MALLTPIGVIRVFVDYNPIACELYRIKTDDNEKINDKYRVVVHFKPDDDDQHLIMFSLKANQNMNSPYTTA